MLPRFLSFCFFLLMAAAPAARAQVQATLTASDQSIQPGHAFTVALRLTHDEHWHTYWINPGTGYPTSIKWELPDGWTAGPIQWPAPQTILDDKGAIIGNGYENTVYLPVTLTPPADLKPGESITLKGLAKWLMCKDVCVPGKADVSLTLPTSSEAPAPASKDGVLIAATLASLPRDIPGWQVSATRADGAVTLHLTGPADAILPKPADLHFFAQDNFIAFDQPQTVTTGSNGELLITLPLSPVADTIPDHLVGVLRSANGWPIQNTQIPGMAVDVPLSTAAATPPANTSDTATIPVGITRATPASTVAVNSLAGTLVLAFIGGLILNLMPCVFPVLGIKILGFVNQAGADRRKVTLHGLIFALGVLLSFWALAGVLAILRAGGDQLGWGFQLQSTGFVFVLAAVMLVFALSMSGVFEFGLRATGVGAGLQQKHGYAGSFFTGVLATVVATPCSAPFLAPALGAALALPTFASFVVFTAIAVGLALPYLLLSIFPQAVKALPRPGAWMETFKQVMAFPLYATVGYLIWVLAGQTAEQSLLFVLLGLTVIAMGVWLYGRYNAPGVKPARARFGLIGGLALLAIGGWLGWPKAPAPSAVTWEPWSTERVNQLRAEGKPIYVDFTARWCFTCQTNKKVVFSSSEVLRQFHDKGVVTLRADWTNDDPLITAELARWNRSAVPFDLLYLPGRPDPILLPEILSPSIVLKALNSNQ
jgi:thiol:disulfide interchange protein DsbD